MLWNFLLITEYRQFLIPTEAGANLGQLLGALPQLARMRPLVLLGELAGVVLLSLLLLHPEAGAQPAPATIRLSRLDAATSLQLRQYVLVPTLFVGTRTMFHK